MGSVIQLFAEKASKNSVIKKLQAMGHTEIAALLALLDEETYKIAVDLIPKVFSETESRLENIQMLVDESVRLIAVEQGVVEVYIAMSGMLEQWHGVMVKGGAVDSTTSPTEAAEKLRANVAYNAVVASIRATRKDSQNGNTI